MKVTKVECIIVDVTLLGGWYRNFLSIASSCILENALQMVFLLGGYTGQPTTLVTNCLQ